ncbi:hypothetical protein [Rhodocyclus tenuis]|uniref:Uncharacterized protein n=1 Tax=Rhodocyclus tenuis TaxID=1066 RepID=A0A840GGA0_RHOTE|nr:hypothetical protein [Rhodocyclus tenuis]MBB4247532.1 hypothetical protein [Rhodocyclus tenuis]
MNENSAQIIDFLAARNERRRQQRRAELARARDAGSFLLPYFPVFGLFRPLVLGAGVYRPAAQYACNPAFQPYRRLG